VHPVDVHLPGAAGATEKHVDTLTGSNSLVSQRLNSDSIHMEGYSTMVVNLSGRAGTPPTQK
jgi:hypothetical protein